LRGAGPPGAHPTTPSPDAVNPATANITAKHVTGSFTADNKPYDGSMSATVLTRSPDAVLGGDAVNLTGGTATFADKNVGTAKVVTLSGASLTGADAGNYILDAVNTTTANITPRAVTLSGTRVYDGTTDAPASILNVANKVTGDTVTVASGVGMLASKHIGAEAISSFGTLVLGSDPYGNYTLTGASGSVTITKRAITIAADSKNKVF